MDRLLRHFLGRFIRRGSITFTTANGKNLPAAMEPASPVSARFLTKEAQRRILLHPELALGETFMDGSFVIEQGSIADALAILMDQPGVLPGWAKPQWWARYLFRHVRQLNLRGRSRRNVARHYDLDSRLYALFLDADWQYSCAYFETPDADLDDAQLAKKRHLAAKLLIGRGERVLDIGSGWGGLGLYLAKSPAPTSPASRCRPTIAGVERPRSEKGPVARGALPAAGLPRRRRPVRPHRIGRHVRACRRRFLRHLLPATAPSCWPTTA